MILRVTPLLLIALLCSSCKDKPFIEFGEVYTTGPTRGPDGELLANLIIFHYEAKKPEPVYILVDGQRVKSVTVDGKTNWRIEVVKGNVKVSDGDTILEVPISEEGTINSNVTVNKSKQMAFDISVGERSVMRLECPKQIIDNPPLLIQEAKQGVSPESATRTESNSSGNYIPQPESKPRSR